MRGHVSPEAMIDVAEGRGGAGERRHLEACGDCRAQVEELRESLLGLASVGVPEPSPLYWEAFRRQVGGRLESEARPARWSSWWLPGLAVAAAAIVAVVPLRPPVGRIIIQSLNFELSNLWNHQTKNSASSPSSKTSKTIPM